MQRRKFGREFKVEAVRLVRERGVSVAQAARDLDVHENVLRKWIKEFAIDPAQAFPGNGQMKPEQLEIERLRREVYNRQRLHSALDYLSPQEYEEKLPRFGQQGISAANAIIQICP
jgi:transposase